MLCCFSWEVRGMKMKLAATLGRTFLVALIACAMVLALAGIAAPVAKAEGEAVLTVTANPPAVAAARAVDLTFTLQNNGAEALQNIHIYNVTGTSSEVTDGVTGQKVAMPDVPAGDTKQVTAKKKSVNGPGAILKYRATYKIGGVASQADFTLTIGTEEPAPNLSFTRTVSKSTVLKGSSISIVYTLKNLGNVDLSGITITDTCMETMPDNAKNIELAAGTTGKTVTVTLIVTADTQSVPTVNYKIKGGAAQPPKTLDPKPIKISDSKLAMDVTADKTQIDNPGDEVNLHFVLSNDGNTSLKNVEVKDQDRNSIQSKITVAANKDFSFDYKVKPSETTSYVFTATGIDSSNNAYSANSTAVVIIVGTAAPEPSGSAAPTGPELTFKVTQDITKLEAPGSVKFTFSINNTSGGKLFNAKITEAKLGDIETIGELPQGEKIVEKSIDVQKTDIYTFTLTATDQDGIVSTINAPVMSINIQPAAKPASSNMGMLMIVLLVIVGLIVIVLIIFIALLLRNRKAKKNGGGKLPPSSPGNTLRRGLEIKRHDKYNDRSGI